MIKLNKKSQKNKTPKELTRFQKFSLFFFKNKRISLFIWLSTLVLGLLTYTTFIQREGFPSVQVPVSIVNANYFVDDKNQVDEKLAKPLSEAIKKVDGVKEVQSVSTSNFANLSVSYQTDLTSDAGSKRVQDAISKLNLPKEAEVSYQTINASKFLNQYDLLISVHSNDPKSSVNDLTEAANSLSKEISKNTEGVSSSEVISQIEEATNPLTGQSALVQKSFDSVGLKKGGEDLTFYNSVNIGIKLNDGFDTLQASDNIKSTISSVDLKKFGDFEAVVSSDLAPLVRSQISSLQENMLEGFVIVAIISFLLVSWRAGLATALSMLTVLLTTVLLLYLFGLSLNVISLFALILSLGLIVDDATIVSEAIDAHNVEGKDRKEIVKESIGKIARASTAGTLTTIFAFAPMLFINGILGRFIRAIPITIITSLALSLVVSLSLIPFFASGFLLTPKKNKKANIIQKVEKKVSTSLADLIRYAGRNKKKGALIGTGFILLSLVFTMIGGSYFSKAGFDIFPSEKDSNELAISLTYAPGSSIEESKEQASLVNQIISSESRNIEEATYSGTGSTSQSFINLSLVDLKEREDTSVQIATRLQSQFDELKPKGILATAASQGAGGPSSDFPVEIRILSEDADAAQNAAKDLDQALNGKSLKTLSGKEFTINRTLGSDSSSLIKRIDSKRFMSLSLGFDVKASSEILQTTKEYVEDNFKAEDLGLAKDSIKVSLGFEEENQDSFNSMLIAFPILLLAMFVLLAVQFKSLLQPIFIFSAIPFSFLGVGAGLYYTNNSASFFVMLGFFALIGIALNNTILITDYALQARRDGLGRVESIAQALQARFRPLLTTSLTSVVALIPLALSDPFWQSLSVTLIFGLLSSTLLVILSFPYYLLAADTLRVGSKKTRKKASLLIHRSK
jgi:multidrug efflux pump subunit AcrB